MVERYEVHVTYENGEEHISEVTFSTYGSAEAYGERWLSEKDGCCFRVVPVHFPAPWRR